MQVVTISGNYRVGDDLEPEDLRSCGTVFKLYVADLCARVDQFT